jgi:hypothetical protein
LVVLDFGFLLRVFVSVVFLLLHMLLIPKERKGMRKGAFYTAHSEPQSRQKNKKMFIQYFSGLPCVCDSEEENLVVIDTNREVVESLHTVPERQCKRPQSL